MFCVKCGKPIPDGQRVCDACLAAEQAQQQAPEIEPMFGGDPAQPQGDSFTLGSPDIEPPKKKKKAGVIAAVTAAVVAVAALVLAVCLNWSSVKGFFGGKAYDSPQEHMSSLGKQSVSKLLDKLSELENSYTSKDERDDSAYSVGLRVQLGDLVTEELESQLGIDMSWLRDIRLDADANVRQNLVQVAAELALSDKRIVSLEAFADTEDMKLWMRLPELGEAYAMLDLKQILREQGISEEELVQVFAQQQALLDGLLEALPDERETAEMIDAYLSILSAYMEQAEELTETVTVDEISQELTVLRLKLTAEELLDAADALLRQAKSDRTLKKIITAIGDYAQTVMQQAGEQSDISGEELYSEFLEAVEDGLQDIAQAEPDSENYLVLSLYVDDSDAVVGGKLRVNSAEQDADENEILYVLVRSGERYEVLAEAGSLRITGAGTVSGGKYSGSFYLRVGGTSYIRLELEDFGTDSRSGALTGTIRIKPTRALLAALDLPAAATTAITGADAVLELVFGGEDADLALNVLAGDELLLGISVQAERTESTPITLPKGGVSITDEDSLEQWAQGLDLSKLMENLTKAGVPIG